MGNTTTKFLGVVSPVPKGDWQNNVAYKILNLVRYNTASYIAKKDVPPNIIPTNEEYWQLLAYDSFKDKDFKTINGQTIIGEGNIEIEGGGEAITVDDQLSSTSTNPVQNKVVFGAVEQVQNTANYASEVAGNANFLANENKQEIVFIKSNYINEAQLNIAKTECKDYADEKAQTAIITAQSLAKEYTDQKFNGANKAVAFTNYRDLCTALNNDSQAPQYSVGQNIYIQTLNVPDLWVRNVSEMYNYYIYNTDEDFINKLNEKGYVQVGFYLLSALETQKVDLTDYAKTEYVDEKAMTAIITAQSLAKEYTDQKIGDISTALDELHTYAQSLINGGVSQ